MTTPDANTSEPRDAAADADTLMGRIIDGEASSDDLRRFQFMADKSGSDLWRKLAMRQVEMAALSSKVEQVVEAADRVEAPDETTGRRQTRIVVAASGWAAALALVASWFALGGAPREGVAGPDVGVVGAGDPCDMTPDQHFQKYMEAEFVVGEHDMVLMDHEALPDGRNRINFVRRIEEWVDVNGPPQTIVDTRGRLKIDPAKYRERQARRPKG